MKSNLLALFVILNFGQNSFGQHRKFDWNRSFGGPGRINNSASVLHNSSIITVGAFTDTVDFNPDALHEQIIASTSIIDDVYIQKFDKKGDLIWVKTIGNNRLERAHDVATDAHGNIYVLGTFEDSVDFDPGPDSLFLSTPKNTYPTYILKLTPDGSFIWAIPLLGNETVEGYSLIISDNSLYIVGRYIGEANFDPDDKTNKSFSLGINDCFILKLTVNGAFDWVLTYGGVKSDFLNNITLDKDFNLIVSGMFQDTLFINSGKDTLISNGLTDCFVQKLDTNGKIKWSKSYGGIYHDASVTHDVDDYNNVYLAGYFVDPVDFDPSSKEEIKQSNGDVDTYLLKLDSEGNFVWVRTFGSRDEDVPAKLVVDQMNHIYLSGYHDRILDLDPESSNHKIQATGLNRDYIAQFDLNGKTQWVEAFGGSIRGFNIDFDNSIFISGDFSIKKKSGPDSSNHFLLSENLFDGFICKWNQCPAALEVHQTCDSFTWIDGITYYESTDSATFKITNPNCSDSIISLNLTVENIDNGITQNGNELKAVEPNAKYQWFDCKNNIEIAGEESRTFTPSANGEYAVIVIGSRCEDTSTCVVMNTIGVDEIHQLAFSVYPNPSDGSFTIKSNAQHRKPIKANITSIEGRVVWEGIIKNNKQTIQLDPIPGVYVVEVLDEGIAKRSKLIIR